jgi:hypothetical protein
LEGPLEIVDGSSGHNIKMRRFFERFCKDIGGRLQHKKPETGRRAGSSLNGGLLILAWLSQLGSLLFNLHILILKLTKLFLT